MRSAGVKHVDNQSQAGSMAGEVTGVEGAGMIGARALMASHPGGKTVRATTWFVTLTLLTVVLLAVVGSCIGASSYRAQGAGFGEQTSILSPHDEMGGRFDGARVSTGFGVLYRNGYTDELAEREGCGGFLGQEPEHVIELEQAMNLKIVVQASSDMVLAVVDPDGQVTCWDENSISNDNVSLERQFSPGRYEVWVGSQQRHTAHAYRLVLSE
jgi:hypothetical protein